MSESRFLRASFCTVVAALPLLASACVLPVGPEFEDPPGNVAPYVASSNPPEGAVLADASPTIEVVLGDANHEDVLRGRWFIDYPVFDSSITREVQEFRLPTTGKAERGKVLYAPNCANDHIAPGVATHRVTLSVADRPFLPEDQAPAALRLDSVPGEGFVVRATWILDLVCP